MSGGSTSDGWLRRVLLDWVFSRGRWTSAVIVEGGFGMVFLLAPYPTMQVLGIRPLPEAAALFRIYGILLASRSLLHHAAFGVPQPRVVLGVLVSDVAFALPSAVAMVVVIRLGLAGPATWAVVVLFAAEATLQLVALAGLRSVTSRELEGAHTASRSVAPPGGPRAY